MSSPATLSPEVPFSCFSVSIPSITNHPSPPILSHTNHPSFCIKKRNKIMGSALYYAGCDEDNYQPHFLDSCFLCQRPLAHNNDIFMYRGNTPFCSQECRQEQIEIDEASERRWKVSSSSSSSSKRSSTKRNTTTKDSRKDSDRTEKSVVRTGAVAVA